MFCRKCGIKIEDGSNFCHECGENNRPTEDTANQDLPVRKSNKNTVQKPFREDFYRCIKSVWFLLMVVSATIFYGINVMNSVLHFTSSDVFISLVILIYGVVAFGLTVPALWWVYLDRSPHSAFVPLKMYAFVNLLKLFLMSAFAVLTVMAVIMGKEEISKGVLYLGDENLSLYLVTLLSQTAKNPSLMLLDTCAILWSTYFVAGLMYHISVIWFLNTTSKRINNNSTIPKGYNVILSISFFVSVANIIYAVCLFAFMKDDIYNVLVAVFKGIFHLMIFLNIRGFGKMLVDIEDN